MERIKWIDSMKGLSICLVVFVHCAFSDPNPIVQGAINVIINFVLTMFFFVGGMVYKKGNIKDFTKTKTLQLLVPYCIAALLFMQSSGIFTLSHFETLNISTLLDDLKRLVFGGRYFNAANNTLWFITCMYFTVIGYNILQNKLNEKSIHIVVFILLLLAYVNHQFFPSFWLPGNANGAFYAIPIYHLGYIYKKHEIYKHENIKVKIGIIILALLVMIGLQYMDSSNWDLKYNKYGIPFVSTICALILVMFEKNLCILINKNKILSQIFSRLGEGSLIIMYAHMAFLIWLFPYFENKVLLFVAVIALSYITYEVFNKFTLTRALLMGNIKDMNTITAFFNKKDKI